VKRSVRSSQVPPVAGRELAGAIVGLGQLQAQLAGQHLVRVGTVLDVDDASQEPDRPLEGCLTAGLVGGGSAPTDGQVGAGGRVGRERGRGGRIARGEVGVGRVQVVMGDLGGGGSVPGSFGQHVGDASVEAGRLVRGELLLQGAAHDGMGEGEAVVGRFPHQPRVDRVIEAPANVHGRTVEGRRQDVEPELLTDERGRCQGVADLGIEPVQPPAHDIVESFGQPVADGPQRGTGIVRIEAAQDLLHEQRVAGRLVRQPAGDPRFFLIDGTTQRLGHQPLYGGGR
jgi:hypothetical protein